jgi:superfamily II DNA or RNA helicase
MHNETVKFIVGDTYSFIDSSPKVLAFIKTLCRARPDGFQHMPKYRRGYWDGYISLVKGKNVPTGLLRMLAGELREQGVKVFHSYSRSCSKKHITVPEPNGLKEQIRDCLDGITLRDYQIDATYELLCKGRGIAKMATNAGKTVIIAALLKFLRSGIVVVNSKDLLYQTADRLCQHLGRPVGLIGDSHMDYKTKSVSVATIQTLASFHKKIGKLEFKNRFGDNRVLIIDECHHIAHNKSFDVLMDIPGWCRYGFSGTPIMRGNLNDLKLIAATGPVQVQVSNADLIEEGWSAVPTVYIHSRDYDRMHKALGQDDYYDKPYHFAYEDGIVENALRNDMICQLTSDTIASGNSVLILVNRLKHGENILSFMYDDYPETPVAFVHGSSSMDDRRTALERLSKNPVAVIATPIFDEGVDVPALDAVILAGGGKSQWKLLQKIGRGLRRKEGSNVVQIHDFDDYFNKHLDRHTNERIKVYVREGFKTEVIDHDAEVSD